MTSSDAPQPPGSPLRDDAADGPLQPDPDDLDQPPPREPDADDHGSAPGVTGEPTQPPQAAALQEENAETSLDQPSQ